MKIDPRRPNPETILNAAEIIRRGGVVVFPTTGLYGLAADATDRHAVKRVFAIKERPFSDPLLVLIPDRCCLSKIAACVTPDAERLMDAFWPGGLTLVFRARGRVLPELTGGSGNIGVRLPAHPVSRGLVKAAGRPVTATSANISRCGGCSRIDMLDTAVANAVDLILDAGPLKGGAGSSVLDLTQTPPLLLREGAISRSRIAAVLGQEPARR